MNNKKSNLLYFLVTLFISLTCFTMLLSQGSLSNIGNLQFPALLTKLNRTNNSSNVMAALPIKSVISFLPPSLPNSSANPAVGNAGTPSGTTSTYFSFLPVLPVYRDPVVLAAGDIASCSSSGDEATANLLDNLSGTVITMGDNAYDAGTIDQFNNCYNPTWGRQKARTFPSVGNHEYLTSGASGYYTYFGPAAGDPSKGYYSYDLGTWHVIVLNSNCSHVGGCGSTSPQVHWLEADLAAHPSLCTLAYWHQPRFSSGEHGNDTAMQPIWQVLYQAGADLVLNGHDHDYERFAPQTYTGASDPLNGIREFVVGTGGKGLRPMGSLLPNSEKHSDTTFGVLKLTLHPSGYDWKFIPVAGQTFTDTGSGQCH